VEALPETGDPFAHDAEKTLVVTADFARVEDLPAGWAPASEPYADAYQRRSAKLAIERKGPRTVYAFERTLHPREFERYDPWTAVRRELGDDELVARIEDEQPLSEEQSALVAEAVVRGLRATAQALADDTLAALYVDGDAALPASGRERASRAVAEALAGLTGIERVGGLLRAVLQRRDAERSGADAGEEVEQLEKDIRATLRTALAGALEREGLPLAARNAALGQLEWLLAASDQTADLGDEQLVVRVRMPGVVVGGNFDAKEEGAAVWRIAGMDLRDRTRVLRVVSVVE
jgi:hypothetical protein